MSVRMQSPIEFVSTFLTPFFSLAEMTWHYLTGIARVPFAILGLVLVPPSPS